MKKENLVYKTEEQKEIMKFLIVLGVVILIIVGVYFFSKIFIKEEVKDLEYLTGSVSTEVAIVGTILNQKEKTYYVLSYDPKETGSNAYATYANYYYGNQKNATKVYYLDLSNGMNKDYYVKDNSNPKATKIQDLKIKNGTLMKIENGKITKYLEGEEAIKKELKVTEEKN